MGRSPSDTTERSLKVRPPEAAEAGLVYASDVEPGLPRGRKGKGFTHFGTDGKRVTDRATVERIRGLVIPPAWKDVWISTRPRGHLHAPTRHARGRQQRIHPPPWRQVRDADKFSRMVGFARALPRIRRRVARDLGQPGLPREKVIATIVRLLEMTYARIGNEEYARDNGSFGLTTLRDRHVTITRSTVRFLFRGKNGRELELGVTNRRVARVVKRCEELPGQMLFQYIGTDGERRAVHSDDVNQYLQEVSGEDYTAKDYRPWSATVLAIGALRDVARFESDAEAKRNVVAAIDSVARRLGHTRAVCRRSYVHPRVIDTYMDGSLEGILSIVSSKAYRNLKADEVAVLALLKRKLPAKAA